MLGREIVGPDDLAAAQHLQARSLSGAVLRLVHRRGERGAGGRGDRAAVPMVMLPAAACVTTSAASRTTCSRKPSSCGESTSRVTSPPYAKNAPGPVSAVMGAGSAPPSHPAGTIRTG